MTEVVFAPDSGAGFIAGFGAVVSALGLLGLYVLLRRGEPVDPWSWVGIGFFVLGGGGLSAFAYREARSVAVAPPGHIELRYTWPRSTRVFDAHDIRQVRVELRGTEHPSPRLVIETRDGETFEGEGSSDHAAIERARALVASLL
jgi:hypothetical protein